MTLTSTADPRPDSSAPVAATPVVSSSTTSRLASLLAAPLLVAIVVQNLTNFAFHAFVGRLLSPDQYGALGAVLAVMVLLSVPLSAVQAAASGLVAEHGWDSASVRSVLRSGVLVSLAVGAVVLALSGVVRDFYRLGSAVDAVVLAPFVVVSIVLALLRGLLLGDGQVRATAASYLVGAFGRLVLGASLALVWGVTGALVGTLLGETLATATAARRVLRRAGSSVTATGLGWRRVLLSCAAVTGLFLFSTVDLLLARHFLFDDASGTYTAAATVAKTVLALPAAATSVYFPRLVLAWRSRDVTVLRTAVVVVCGLAFLGAVVVAALPGLVLTLLYGAGTYAGGADLVRLLALVAGATSLVSVLTYAGLARKAWTIAVPTVGASFEIALIWMRHGTAEEIARMSLAALVPTLVVMATWECAAWVRRGTAGRHEA